MIKIISKFALLFTILAIIFLIISNSLFSPSPIVIAVQVVAVGLGIWARRSFQAGQFSIHARPVGDGILINRGPYHFIRHPMYTAAQLIIWSGILSHFSPMNVAIGFIAIVVMLMRITTEEEFLRSRYADYTNYALKTKKLIPFVF